MSLSLSPSPSMSSNVLILSSSLVLVLSILPTRLSAFGGNSPYGRLDAYIKLEQLGEGSYATVFKGFSNLTKQVQFSYSTYI